jgi:hypothetical protein
MGSAFGMPSPFRTLLRGGAAAVYSPSVLFASGEAGDWFDPSDLSRMFTDTAGTTPVTADGQSVALILGQRRGADVELVTNGTFDSNITGWAASSSATLSWVSGTLRVTKATTGAFPVAEQTITTVAGRAYRVTASYSNSFGRDVHVSTSGISRSFGTAASGSASFVHVATGTSMVVQFGFSSTSGNVSDYIDFDNISVKEVALTALTQSTLANRPIYAFAPSTGVRNLLTYTEAFDNAAWLYLLGATRNGATTAPDGTNTAQLVTFGAQFAHVGQTLSAALTSGTVTNGLWIRRISGNTNLQLRANTASTVYMTGITISDTWTFYSASWVHDTVNNLFGLYVQDRNASGFGQIAIWHPQLELGSTATAYQRVNSALGVTEAGVPTVHWLKFDGTTDSLASAATLNLSGTGQATLCVGVRKNDTDDFHCLAEFGPDASSTANTFGIWAPWALADGYGFLCRGPTNSNVYQPQTYNAPTTNVLTGVFDVTGANISTAITPRVNGVVERENPSGIGAAGTVFSSQTLNVGLRSGGTFPLNGNIYFLLIRGALTSGADLTALEAFAGAKAGVPIPELLSVDIYDRALTTVEDRFGSTIQRRP